jgi:hypothetical protein
MTTAIVMIALLRKLIADKKERWLYAGMVILAANAGGAWSPIGDVTTIMLWIKGQVTTLNIIVKTLIPSLVCMVVPVLIVGATLLLEMSTFGTFFRQTGTSLGGILSGFTWGGWLVTAICLVAMGILLYILVRNLSIYKKVKTTLSDIWQGVTSLRNVRSLPSFLLMTVGIWLCYFLHYYLTFFCFDFTAHLGLSCAMVTFVVGSIAVIVPTPNGAGPWHFAVKTMLILYGVQADQALYFVLIVHTVQTLLVVVLGVYAWLRLSFVKREERGEWREERGEKYEVRGTRCEVRV